MSQRLRVAMAQINLHVGDVDGNVARMQEVIARARDALSADIVVFPELSLSGYPPEDLVLRRGFLRAVEAGLQRLATSVRGIDAVVGYPELRGDAVYNAAGWLREGRVVATYHKQLLPNYSVFDEKRYFQPGREACVVPLKGVPVGVTVCEDVWAPGPVEQACAAGARFVLNLNASPFHADKTAEREHVTRARARDNRVPIVYVNLVGGQDELVFDGASFVMSAEGAALNRASAFEEALHAVDFEIGEGGVRPVVAASAPVRAGEDALYAALVLGVRDYAAKNRFDGAVLGLSGGIDSALTLCIAADALGPERVHAVMMPSRYTARMSVDDAAPQARALGVKYSVLPIEPMVEAFNGALADEFRGRAPDVTEENIQSRIRGVLLMAVSNKTGCLLLTTGNKSELAVGYATLYGDMAGGFAPIKDVYKTGVYRLAAYRNGRGAVIPARVIERAPSAELRADQRDTDSLPPYPTLDAILEQYIEHDREAEDIAAAGFERALVERVIGMVVRNEYKRRQAPPGVRVSPRAFGRDWRYPISRGRVNTL